MANYGHGEHYEIMRSKMLYTAAQLFLQKGYAMTSLKEILAEAGTNTGVLTRTFGSKENTDTTSGGFDEIVKKASKSIKNIPLGKMITTFCGLRAVGDTGDFIINSPKHGFINAAGIESPGLSACLLLRSILPDFLKIRVRFLKKIKISIL